MAMGAMFVAFGRWGFVTVRVMLLGADDRGDGKDQKEESQLEQTKISQCNQIIISEMSFLISRMEEASWYEIYLNLASKLTSRNV